MRYGSVCSGIEAATAAWEPLGWTPVFFSKFDPEHDYTRGPDFPSAVLSHHYPNVPNLGDMTRFKEWPDAAIDVLVGGTPCQSFSVAGLRKGMADPRGNLALTFLAIVDRYRPQFVVWENVPGVLSSLSHDAPDPCPPPPPLDMGCDGAEVETEDEYAAEELHAFNCFLAGLSELGYGYSYRVLNAMHFGVPQRRRRVFVVGYLGDWQCAAAVLFERASLLGDFAPSRKAGQGITASPEGIAGNVSSKWSKGTGGPAGDEHYNLIAPDVASALLSGPASPASHGKRSGSDRDTLVAHSLCADGFDANEDGTGRGTPLVTVAFQERGREGGASLESQDDLAYALTAPSGGGRRQEMNVAVPVVFESRFARNGRGAPEEIVPPLKAQSGETGKGDAAPLVAYMPARSFGADGGIDERFAERDVSDALHTSSGSGNKAPLIAFQANSRDEVRLMGGDGEISGSLSAEPGSRGTTTFIAAAIDIRNGTLEEDGAAQTIQAAGLGSERGGNPNAIPHTFSNAPMSITSKGNGEAFESEISGSLQSAGGGQAGQGYSAVRTGMQVRRLMPEECEALQGFKKYYTLIPWKGKPAAECPDGNRYKALGNSMAIPCMFWIGQRIATVAAVLARPANDNARADEAAA